MKIKIFVLIAVIMILAIIPLLIFVIVPSVRLNNNLQKVTISDASLINGEGDRIHFLSTGSSDAILLESQGEFALIDAGEDSDNPRGFEELDLDGYEDRVLSYLKTNAANEKGTVYLDFVLGTHSHSDHIGGFDTVISDPEIEIGRAYLKEYNSKRIDDYEVEKWDNQEVYDQMYNALKEKNIEVIPNADSTPFALGNFTITLFNTEDNVTTDKIGENDNSYGVLVEKNGTRIFLAGDIDNLSGDEKRLAPEIGKVDLLKVGHHSYSGSTSSVWLKNLMPKYCIVTNDKNNVDVRTLWRISRIADSPVLITGKENGIVAEIGDNGNITFYNNIHSGE